MDLGLPTGQLLLLAASLVGAGLATGFVAGLLGIGGGAILVPVLFEVFTWLGVDPAQRMHLTIGTGLAVIVPTTARSFLAHRARGAVDLGLVRRLAPWVGAGVVLGVLFAARVPSAVLQTIWVAATLVLLVKLVFGRDGWRLGDEIPGHLGIELYGCFVGALSAVMSIAGGAYITLLLTLYGRTPHQAVGTAAAFGPIIAAPGMLGFMWAGWGVPGLPPGSLGYVSLLGAALIIPTSVLAAPWGARLAYGISRRALELALAAFLGTAVLRLLVGLIAGR